MSEFNDYETSALPTASPWKRDPGEQPRLCAMKTGLNEGWIIAEFFGPDAEANYGLCRQAPELQASHKELLIALRNTQNVLIPMSVSGQETHAHYALMASRLLSENINPAIQNAEALKK